jgi:hypothetical protein
VRVPRTDSETWRLSTTFANPTLHAALFVRDAFHLKPEDETVIPPPLSGDVPNLTTLLLDVDTAEASRAWVPWWERVLRYEGAVARGEYAEDLRSGNLRAMSAARAEAFDPPKFATMDDTSALQSMARLAHREALAWSKYHAAHTTVHEDVVANVVWEMCSSLHVNPAQLDATIIVLDVEGSWSAFCEPGVLLCSPALLRKDAAFEDRLREAFLQNLGNRERALVRLRETALDLYEFLDRV